MVRTEQPLLSPRDAEVWSSPSSAHCPAGGGPAAPAAQGARPRAVLGRGAQPSMSAAACQRADLSVAGLSVGGPVRGRACLWQVPAWQQGSGLLGQRVIVNKVRVGLSSRWLPLAASPGSDFLEKSNNLGSKAVPGERAGCVACSLEPGWE